MPKWYIDVCMLCDGSGNCKFETVYPLRLCFAESIWECNDNFAVDW